MFDKIKMNNQAPYVGFTYWFTRINKSHWLVHNVPGFDHLELIEGRYVGDANTLSEVVPDEIYHGIMSDFSEFWNARPEYFVGLSVDRIEERSMEELIDIYETQLVGVALIRAKFNGVADPDKAFDKIHKCLEWLRSTGFYTDPASSMFHESCPGGLLMHSLKVANKAIELCELPTFNTVHYQDAVLVALVHDWCKIDQYESFMRNVKDDATGEWRQVPSYRRKEAMFPLGHGVASLYMTMNFFKLSTSEALAIRWHMGKWRCVDDENDELQSANEKVPLVHLLQFADQLAIVKY